MRDVHSIWLTELKWETNSFSHFYFKDIDIIERIKFKCYPSSKPNEGNSYVPETNKKPKVNS